MILLISPDQIDTICEPALSQTFYQGYVVESEAALEKASSGEWRKKQPCMHASHLVTNNLWRSKVIPPFNSLVRVVKVVKAFGKRLSLPNPRCGCCAVSGVCVTHCLCQCVCVCVCVCVRVWEKVCVNVCTYVWVWMMFLRYIWHTL